SEVLERAVDHLVDEVLRLGAPLRVAVGHAACHDVAALEALEHAHHRRDARLPRRARAAVGGAVGAGLVRGLALAVAAHRAGAAVLLARGAGLVHVAHAVGAARAFAAVLGAGVAVLVGGLADAVAAALARAAVGRAVEAVLLGHLADAVAA